MDALHIDIETYCDLDLKKVGAYRYVEHPSFLILMAAWSLGDTPVEVLTDLDSIYRLPLWDDDVLKVAHNASFERLCFSRAAWDLGTLRRGTYLPLAPWHDTQATAAVKGYPQKLEDLAPRFGVKKDSAGTRLINIFSKPNRQGRRTLPEEKPEEWEAFKAYCVQDVETLKVVDAGLGRDFPTSRERRVWLADQTINDRGIAVDVALATEAVGTAELNREDQELEVWSLSKGEILNPGSRPQMHGWLERQGHPLPNLQRETVEAAIATLPEGVVRQVLVLQQELALVAAKKFSAALDRTCEDGRLRGAFHYHGAHTGRWAGRGVQLQNLPSETLRLDLPPGTTPEEEFQAMEEAIASRVLEVLLGEQVDATTLKALVRSMFLGPMSVVDYAAIEARVLAWLAGEEWALAAFRKGRDIYVETAERMGGLTRKQGKVAVLALGYQGGINSLRAMGGEGNDEQMQFLVDQWRKANPHIVRYWKRMQNAFGDGGPVGAHAQIEVDGDNRIMRLPSGRGIVYHDVRWETYMEKQPSGKMKRKEGWRFFSPTMKARVGTYGGRLTENITQAVARDVLAEALVRLEAAGLPVVGHVHDEILVEGQDLSMVNEIMTEVPRWATGLPIDGDGFVCRRYRKD